MASIFQRAYDWIKGIKSPQWLVDMLQELQDIMVTIFMTAGKAYIKYLEELILDAVKRTDLTDREKFEFVFNNARASGIQALNDLRDNELTTLINYLYTNYKANISF